jgi:short-subunit dehydrogenase involved in D-alanine esterification of teichoic acids
MVEVTNRTVFIAGGTSGIGRGLAQRFADAGSTVIVGGRSAQLDGTGIEVTELVPPAVATPAMAKLNPAAVPLDEYLDEVMDRLEEQPTPREVVVKAAQSLRWAERDGTYAGLLERRSAPLKNLPGR